jgi:hypothetical protein
MFAWQSWEARYALVIRTGSNILINIWAETASD